MNKDKKRSRINKRDKRMIDSHHRKSNEGINERRDDNNRKGKEWTIARMYNTNVHITVWNKPMCVCRGDSNITPVKSICSC